MNNTTDTTTSQLSKRNAAAQCLRLIERLRKGPANTFQIRDELNIAHPAGRIHDLKKRGFIIETHTSKEATTEGAVARVALYVLVEEPEEV